MELPKLLLASSSPRRRQILENMGLMFSVISSNGKEESANFKNVQDVTRRNAELKLAGAQWNQDSCGIVIAADTLVALNGQVLGKPHTVDDARKMLKILSGNSHSVYTGVALRFGEKNISWFEESKVYFNPISEAVLEQYLLTQEPYDKAGSYAVQGMACVFIKKIEGSFTNVMGLPAESLLLNLEKISGMPLYQWFKQK